MIDRAWIDWPDAPGFWWMALGDSEPVLTLVDDALDAHDLELDGWWFRNDAAHLKSTHHIRFLPTGLDRPQAPPRPL